MEQGSHALLQAVAVEKRFAGHAVLRDGSLDLHAGRVHALCGGNGAGKSTFLNILTGHLRRDGGHVRLRGQPVDFHSPAQALAAGIAIITQELSPVLDMSVAENLYLGREPLRLGGWAVDHARMRSDAHILLRDLGFDICPRARLRSLSLAQRQLVEIAKAIGRQGDILIMDEPTSAIGEAETEVLFQAMRRLTARGTGVIYVSHRIGELFAIADDYTVLRDGHRIASGKMADTTREHLVQALVGTTAARAGHCSPNRPPTPSDAPANARALSQREKPPPLLQARGYSRRGQFQDIDISVDRGEILGIYGLMGAGRSEFVNALYGLNAFDAGTLRLDGIELRIRHPRHALAHGLALLTEDRKESGLVGVRSVRENIMLSSLSAHSRLGFISRRRERRVARDMIERLQIRLASPEQPAGRLSGGNQQKVVLSRCLLSNPRVLLCDEPTRGIDEGAKQQIYRFLGDFVAADRCALVVSSDLDEILRVSDRIAVFRRGRLVAELARGQATPEALTHLAS